MRDLMLSLQHLRQCPPEDVDGCLVDPSGIEAQQKAATATRAVKLNQVAIEAFSIYYKVSGAVPCTMHDDGPLFEMLIVFRGGC